jgi:hypothetical protein
MPWLVLDFCCNALSRSLIVMAFAFDAIALVLD